MATIIDKQARLGQQISKIFLAIVLVGGLAQAAGGIVWLTDATVVVDDVGLMQGAGSFHTERSGDVLLEATKGQLTFEHSTFTERLAVSVPALVLGITITLAAWLLIGVVRRTQEGDPFTRHNATALTRAALIALVGGSLWMLVDALGRGYLTDQGPWDLAAHSTFSLAPLAAAGVLLVIAGVFRQGVVLREETEGLV